MQNRLQTLFADKNRMKRSVYFMAGFPKLGDTVPIVQALEKAGVDFIEIGFPFSDPLADGPIIQACAQQALQNGMSLKLLFKQLKTIRHTVRLPLVLMGYLNPILQYGIENFVKQCEAIGIDGLIVPDLPVTIYVEQYKILFENHHLSFIPLITPSTSTERIRYLDAQCTGFIYVVSSYGTTGNTVSWPEQEAYFKKVKSLTLKNPLVIGFGIRQSEDIQRAKTYFEGAIVGSAFISHLMKNPDEKKIDEFVKILY